MGRVLSNFGLLTTLGFRNVLRNPKRSLLTLLAIAIGVWSSVCLAALARGISAQMTLDAIKNLTGHICIHEKNYLDDPVVDNSIPGISGELLAKLDSPPIMKWAARVNVPGAIVSERETAGISLVGIDPEQERGLSFIPEAISDGRYLEGVEDTGILVGKRLLELLRTDLGKRVVIMSQHKNGKVADRGFRIVGVFDAELESTEKSVVFVGRAVAQKFLGLEDGISLISALGEDVDHVDQMLDHVRPLEDPVVVTPWSEMEPLVMALTKVQNGFLKIWFLLVVIAVSFGLINTLFMAIFERTREIGLFQSLGMSRAGILVQIVIESFFILLLGTAVGNVLGFLTLYLLRGGIDLSAFAQGAEMAQISSHIYPKLLFGDLVVANAMIVVLSLAASFYPAWKASRLLPVEAFRKG